MKVPLSRFLRSESVDGRGSERWFESTYNSTIGELELKEGSDPKPVGIIPVKVQPLRSKQLSAPNDAIKVEMVEPSKPKLEERSRC